MILIYERDAKTRLSKAHGNAATHGAGADNANVFHGLSLRADSHAINLARRALGEKQVPEGGGLRVLHAGLKRPTLCRQTLVESHSARRFEAIQNALRCGLSF